MNLDGPRPPIRNCFAFSGGWGICGEATGFSMKLQSMNDQTSKISLDYGYYRSTSTCRLEKSCFQFQRIISPRTMQGDLCFGAPRTFAIYKYGWWRDGKESGRIYCSQTVHCSQGYTSPMSFIVKRLIFPISSRTKVCTLLKRSNRQVLMQFLTGCWNIFPLSHLKVWGSTVTGEGL